MEHFETLTPAELTALRNAPVLIVVLVGAADGKLDREERTWAERLIQSRTYNKPTVLNPFYKAVYAGFEDNLDRQLAALPKEPESRNAEIARQLTELNPVLAKLDLSIAAAMYKGFLALAEETAVASGGFLRIGAVNDAERNWFKLPMLTPIFNNHPPQAEESETD